jgi:cbb3-type cytochrome oxidase maturation protein
LIKNKKPDGRSFTLAPLALQRVNHKMEILYVLIPVSVLLVLAILAVLAWSIHSGQFEDIEQEGLRILRSEGLTDQDSVEPRQK